MQVRQMKQVEQTKKKSGFSPSVAAALAVSALLSAGSLVMSPGAFATGKTASKQQKAEGTSKESSKQVLAPGTIMVEASLVDALNQVKALKAQVKSSEVKGEEKQAAQLSPEFLSSAKAHTQEIADSVKKAQSEATHLKSRVERYPDLANSEAFRSMEPAVSDVEQLNAQWEKQASVSSYWKNRDQVNSDLDRLEQRIDSALKKTKDFGSKIEVSSIG